MNPDKWSFSVLQRKANRSAAPPPETPPREQCQRALGENSLRNS